MKRSPGGLRAPGGFLLSVCLVVRVRLRLAVERRRETKTCGRAFRRGQETRAEQSRAGQWSNSESSGEELLFECREDFTDRPRLRGDLDRGVFVEPLLDFALGRHDRAVVATAKVLTDLVVS